MKRNDKAEGTIVDQDPPAGTVVEKGTSVKVEVVSGKELVTVPQLTGLTEADAIRAITDAKLTLGIADRFVRPGDRGRVGHRERAAGRPRGADRDADRLRGLEGARAESEPDAQSHAEPDAKRQPDDRGRCVRRPRRSSRRP